MINILGKPTSDSGQSNLQRPRSESSTRRSLSRIFRLPTKRKKEWPTCEEGIHYPVFDRRDPRHNPLAASNTWSFRVLKAYRNRDIRQATHRGEALPTLPLSRAPRSLIVGASRTLDTTGHPEQAATDSDDRESHNFGTEGAALSESNTEEDPELGVGIHRAQGSPAQEYYTSRRGDISLTVAKRVSLALPSSPRRLSSSESRTSSLESPIPHDVLPNEERDDILTARRLGEKRSIVQPDYRTSNNSPTVESPEDERYDYFADNRFQGERRTSTDREGPLSKLLGPRSREVSGTSNTLSCETSSPTAIASPIHFC